LTFWDEHAAGTPQDDELIVGEVTAAGSSYAWGHGELQDLPNRPLEDVFMEYDTPHRDTEVYVFACDPKQQKEWLQGLTEWTCDHWGCESEDALWNKGTVPGVSVPHPVAVPQQPSLVHLDLTTSQFAPYDFLQAPCSVPDGAVSVKAARLYQHGLCSYPMALAGLMHQVSDAVWQGFVDEMMAESGPDLAAREWFHTFAYLDHEEGAPLDLRGGFHVDLYYRVELWEAFVNDLHLWFNTNYRFTLGSGADAGLLGVKPAFNYAHVEGYDAQAAADGMKNALMVTLPDAFLANSAAQQLSPPMGPCWGTPTCGFVAGKFAQAINDGGDLLGLSKPEKDQMIAVANAEDGNGEYKNWRCVSSESAGDQCHYVLRAKRINVTPTDVELVWFDDKERDNPTYALWVAAHADPETAPDTIAELCKWQQDPYPLLPPGGTYYRAEFAKYNAFYAEALLDD